MNADGLLALYDRVAEAPDAIARLRRFVLDLAVRGKLVAQDPADEPASELLNRITAEKARLVAAGEIKQRKFKFRPREDSPEFSTPNGWELTDLDSVALKITDGTHKTPTYVSSGVPFVSVKDFSAGRLDLSSTRFIPLSEHELLYKRCDPRRGDILLGRIGTLGKAVLVNTDIKFSLFVSVGLIRFDHANTDRVFFQMTLNSPFVEEEFNRIKIGGGTHTNKLNLGDLHTVALPLPPLAEQHRIVAKVDELMDLCDQLQASRNEREATRDRLAKSSLARLTAPHAEPETFRSHARFAVDALPALTARADQVKQLRQTILNLAVRGKLVAQDPTGEPISAVLAHRQIAISNLRPFDIPLSWAWVHVGAISKSRLGKMLDKAKNKGTPRRYLRNVNIRWCDFDLSDVLEMRFEDTELLEFSLQRGDILICEGGEPGRAAVWDERESNIYFQKAIHRVRFLNIVESHFFVIVLRSSADDGRLATYFTGTGIRHFTGRGLRAYVFPIAPIAEQRRIVAKVDELMAVCERLEASLAAADTTRTHLLKSLIDDALAPALDGVESSECRSGSYPEIAGISSEYVAQA